MRTLIAYLLDRAPRSLCAALGLLALALVYRLAALLLHLDAGERDPDELPLAKCQGAAHG
jgi:hypothetical protein